MMKPLLNPETETQVDAFAAHPGHALIIVAPPGAGKQTIALYVASMLLDIPPDKLAAYPYFMLLAPANGKSISIEGIREITHFLALRTTGRKAVARVVVIDRAHLMTTQAQNALLKTIEEPPAGTVLILTAPSDQGLLPTIRSRVQALHLRQPAANDVAAHFAQTYKEEDVRKAMAVSGGLPGLTHTLLQGDSSHPLYIATSTARAILQKTAFERLCMIDELSKDKQKWLDTLFILARMADISLMKAGVPNPAAKRWQHILAACHEAQSQMLASAQIKLVLLNFMLAI